MVFHSFHLVYNPTILTRIRIRAFNFNVQIKTTRNQENYILFYERNVDTFFTVSLSLSSHQNGVTARERFGEMFYHIEDKQGKSVEYAVLTCFKHFLLCTIIYTLFLSSLDSDFRWPTLKHALNTLFHGKLIKNGNIGTDEKSALVKGLNDARSHRW